MSESTYISSNWNANMINSFMREGIDPRQLCEVAGVDLRECMQLDGQVPVALTSNLWRAAEKITGDTNIGLVLGSKQAVLGLYNLLSTFWEFDSLLSALREMSRHTHLLAGSMSFAVVKKEQGYWIDVQVDHGHDPVLPHVYDSGIALFVQLIRQMANSDTSPLKVTFTHPLYGKPDKYSEILGCPVEFGASSTGILVEHEVLEGPISTDEILPNFNEKVVSDVAIAGRYDEFSNQVKSVIKILLPTQKTQLADVASQFSMSPRTFQRRLVESGWMYQDLMDDVRKSLAIEYICQDNYRLKTVAYRLGYKAPASLSKNFKRWYACTPGEYRREHFRLLGDCARIA